MEESRGIWFTTCPEAHVHVLEEIEGRGHNLDGEHYPNWALVSQWSNKRSLIEPNFPDNIEEDEDARREREINEALEAIDAIRDSDLDLNEERTKEDVSIAKEIPS